MLPRRYAVHNLIFDASRNLAEGQQGLANVQMLDPLLRVTRELKFHTQPTMKR